MCSTKSNGLIRHTQSIAGPPIQLAMGYSSTIRVDGAYQPWDTINMTTARALPTNSLAPWAEIVPGHGAMTVADLVALPDDEVWRYEVVDGVLGVGSSVYKATRLAGRLFATLLAFVLTHDLGDVTPPDGTYDLDASGQSTTGLVPDVGYIRAELLPRINPDKAISFAPDLAIEIALDNQYRPAMGRKAACYLDLYLCTFCLTTTWCGLPSRSTTT